MGNFNCSFVFDGQTLVSRVRPLTDPAWAAGSPRRRLILCTVAVVWLLIVLATVWHHEFWRDEVRALSIAIAAPSLWDLPKYLTNEGHPIVWYALLRIGHQVLGSPLALPVVSVLVAFIAVLIFLFRSPFSLGLKLLFVFSVLPLYEYSVMARNYGISMLVMFLFAALYPYRRRHPFVLAGVLALLANTNIHSLLIASILTLLWLWDEVVVDRQSLTTFRLALLGLAGGLIFTAFLFAIKTVLPDERTIVTQAVHANTIRSYLHPFLMVLRWPWLTMDELLPFRSGFWDGLLLGMLVLGLTVRTRLALGLLAAILAQGYLFTFVYPGRLRHEGILLLFTLVLYWMDAEAGPLFPGFLPGRLRVLALSVVLPSILLWDGVLAFSKVQQDFKAEMSSTKALGQWLSSHPELQDAIILCEPDYTIEALPYYYGAQHIYIPRESRFGTWVRFSTESMSVMSIGQLMDAAQRLKETESQTVLVVLGFPARDFEQNTSKAIIYKRVLVWTPAEWQRFKQSTKRLAEFRSSVSDENFDLYQIR